MAVFQKCLAALVGGALALLASTPFARAQTYTLVQGLDKFEGSTTAWHLLETNGFVVADPTFKQIFEPYLDESTPVFITPDSAWHAYHALISEGIHDLEMSQKRLLLDFSRRLLASIKEQNKSPGADLSELARFVDIGLALQDETFRKSLPDDEKRIAESLLSGKREVKTGIGFPLRPKAVQTTEHEGAADSAFYVAARQYYATVDFRLSDARETRLALCLAWLIHKNGDLIQLWHQLSDPWDAILAPAEDGTVSLYWDLAANSPASDVTLAALLKNAAMLQTRLAESLPEPKSNDQQLGAGDAVDFGKLIKGFRLLPSRRLLGESWVQHMSGLSTTEKNQLSALEFFVGSPTIRSAAAVRALAALDGNATVETARKLDVGALPDSLYGRALRLLATLQEPLPEQVAPALRSQAWADKQLWSQMGAWAEAEHSEGGNRSVWVAEGANVKPSIGIVAPYPKFFEGLSKLALDAAATFEKAGIDEPFDSKTAARKLLEGILWQEGLAGGSQDETEHATGLVEQFAQFWQRTIQSHQTETENNPPAAQKLMNELETLARRCSTQTAPTDTDRDVLQHFFQDRQTVPKLLKDFAPFCDKLAGLAQKNLEGAELTDDESKWISDYGTTLAHFQCYTGSSADASRDDFPVVNRVPINSEHAGSFYTALGRPQALYIILPFDGKLRLFRGAVMTYREFVRPDADSLDEPSWRALAHTGNVPPPPAFTKNFQADRDAAELIKSFTAGNEENPDYKELSEAVEELQSRVTDRDVPALIAALDKFLGEQPGPSADGIAAALSKLHWESHQKELLALLTRNDGQEVRTIAPILFQRPEALDVTYLSTNLEHVEPPARRVYCALLSRVPQTDQTRATLLRALSDSAPGVRWEAATALANGNENAPQKVNALLERLNDENEYVMAAAVSSIAQLKATNAAAALLTNLQDRLLKPEPSMESLQPQGDAVQSFALNLALNPASTLPRGGGPRRSRPMRPFMAFPGRGEASPARDALIEALGDLNYQPAEESIFNLLDGPHAVSAGKALKELAPEKLARRLEAEACDKKADPLVRDRALQLLGTPPATTSAAGLIPLLDDTTTVPMIARRAAPAGREWRICDRAAATIATLLGRTVRIVPMQPIEQRDQQIEQLRESLKAAY